MYSLEELNNFFKEDLFATKLLGTKIVEVKEGYAMCQFEFKKDHQNALGNVMGGAIFTLADFTFAVATNQYEDHNTVSTTANVSFLRPGSGKYLYAEAIRVKDGKKVCFYDVNIYNDEEALIARVNICGTHIAKNK